MLAGHGGVHPATAAPGLLALGIAITALGAAAWIGKRKWVSTPLDLPIAATLAWFVVTTLLSTAPTAALPQLVPLLTILAGFTVATQVWTTPESIQRGAYSLLVVTLLTALVAGIDFLASGRGYPTWPIYNSNHLGGFFAVALPLMVGLASHGRGPAWLRPVAVTGTALVAAMLATTSSRGAVGAVAITGALFIVPMGLKKKKHLWLGPGLLVGMAGVVLLASADPLAREFSEARVAFSLAERWTMWKAGLIAFADHPIFGWGPGTFRRAFAQYRTAETPIVVRHAHQQVVHLLTEGGLPALLIALWGGSRYLGAIRRARQQHRPTLRGIATGCLAGVTAAVLHAQLDFTPHIPAAGLFMAAVAALGLAALQVQRSGARMFVTPTFALAPVAPVYTILGLALLATTSWLGTSSALALRAQRTEREHGAPAALSAYATAARLNPWDARFWAQQGRAQYKAAFTTPANPALLFDAARSFENATRLDERYSAAWADLGATRRHLGEFIPAAEAFTRAVTYDPIHPSWHMAQGDAWLEAGAPFRAGEAYGAAVTSAPTLLPSLVDRVLLARGPDFDLLAMLVDESPQGYYDLGKVLAVRGFRVEAWRLLSSAALAEPSRPEFAQAAAQVALESGNADSAEALLQQAVAAAPEDATLWEALGNVLLARGDVAGAEKALAKAKGKDTNSHAGTQGLAKIALDRGNRAEAERIWNEVAKARPRDPEPQLALSNIAEAAGESREALTFAREARTVAPCDHRVIRRLVNLYEARHLYAAAARELEGAADRCNAPEYRTEVGQLRSRWSETLTESTGSEPTL